MSTESVTETTAPATSAPEAPPQAPPTEAPLAADAATAPPVDGAPPAEAPVVEDPIVTDRYQKSLERLMSQARDNRRQQQDLQGQQQSMELARRIQEAAQYGPDAVLKAVGMEQKKLDLRDILGDDDTDNDPPTVKELKKKVAELEVFIKAEQEEATVRKQTEHKQAVSAWERNEMAAIGQFVDTNKERFPFVAELKQMGSTKDIYGGIISMHQQGYTPSYDDVAELVENRIEDLLETLAQSPKFSQWASKRLKAQPATKAQSRPTLSGALNADSAAHVSPDGETDEENRRRALQAAYAAKEAALKQIKARE